MRLARWGVIFALVSLQGCASYWAERRADKFVASGQPAEGVKILEGLAHDDPLRYRMKYVDVRDGITRDLMKKAQEARRQGRLDDAGLFYQQVLAYDPLHSDAQHGLEILARDRREQGLLEQAQQAIQDNKPGVARSLLQEILVANPDNASARQLKGSLDIERNRLEIEEPALASALAKPVSLEFRNASLQAVMEVLSQASGLNFIFDRDVKTDLRTTIFARNTTVEDALNVILRTSQLTAKTLNQSTLLIYPATTDKANQYEDLVVRTFYLGSADPKKAQEMVKSIVSPKAMFVDDKQRTLIVRDTLSVIETVERLLTAYDIAPPEVVLEVEVFEVSHDSLLNVGVQYPDSVSTSVYGAAGRAGQLTVDEVENLGKGNFRLFFPDPLAILNLRQTSGKTHTLANPRIRVKSLEKAKVLVGDKVPVITTTTNQTSTAMTESVSYLDVGLKLEVEPEIHVNNDVSINISLEVSNIIKEIQTATGLLTYQIGTRSASTVLRLRDGETQALAGLLKNEQRDSATHLPGLGKIPLIGHLFSNETNTDSNSEIVLLLTPHVVRSLATPDAHVVEFASGTSARPSTTAFRLKDADQVSDSNRKVMAPPGAGSADSQRAERAIPDAVRPASQASPTKPTDSQVPSGASAPPDPSSPVSLEVVTPAKVQAGKEFSVSVLSKGQGMQNLQFDLAFDSHEISMLKAAPVVALGGFTAEQVGSGIHVELKGVPVHEGPVAVVSLQAGKASKDPVRFQLRNVTGQLTDAQAAIMQPATDRQMLVIP